jgi:starch synthase
MFIANDWQSALLPVYLTHRMRVNKRHVNSRCIFIVHNFGYQGIYPLKKLVPSEQGPIPVIIPNISIDDLCLNFTGAYEHLLYNYPPEQRSYDGDDGNVFNLTKGAIMTCDRILTVSEGYADEMKTAEGGFSLDCLVRDKQFFLAGIINGIDAASWNPRTDPYIARNYTLEDLKEGKAACKEQLQEKCGLQKDAATVLVSFVGRLTAQKGIDLIFEVLEWLMTDTGNGVTGRVQVLLMGNGDEHFVTQLDDSSRRWPGRVSGIPFDPQTEHVLYAGSDLLLMPSRYEPCGLPQMCAQRYGTLPVVTLCGGLKDSVIVEPPELATGFGILPLNIHKLKENLYRALDTFYNDSERFVAMQERGIQTDFSWCKRIDEYEKHIDWTMADPPYVR